MLFPCDPVEGWELFTWLANEMSRNLGGLLSEKLAAFPIRTHIRTASTVLQQRQRLYHYNNVGHTDGAVLRQEEDW